MLVFSFAHYVPGFVFMISWGCLLYVVATTTPVKARAIKRL